jgi:DNA-binding transcriptional LysR family regulator
MAPVLDARLPIWLNDRQLIVKHPLMIQIEDLRLVHALAKSASLSAAARSMNVTAPALSVRLKRLEAQLGINLAVRSAHRLGLTSEGERLAAEAAQLLDRLETVPEMLRSEGQALSGALRVCAPFGFGRLHVAPLLGKFAKLHPRIRIHLDLLETPWPTRRDADVVIHIGEVRDSSWIAHPLAPNERWLCASPGYLKSERFVPTHPRDVLEHPCICIRENEEDVTLWHFRKRTRGSKAAKPNESVRVTPAMTSNDGDVARQWCEQGLGLVLRSEWDAAAAVARGRLRRLLPQWSFGDVPAVALTPARKRTTARVVELIRFLQAGFQPRAPWRS